MKKLIQGIIDFREKVVPGYRETFARLALGQKPDALFIACSDSRVVPNLFASTDPGDLFVVRNVGNLIPPCGTGGFTEGDESEAAALEFSLRVLNVKDIIVCGHSECGAMMAIQKVSQGEAPPAASPHLASWLRHGASATESLNSGRIRFEEGISEHNRISQLNVLLQLDHLRTYPVVNEKLSQKRLSLHAWWFDIARAEVFAFDSSTRQFALIDENTAPFTL